MFDRSQYVEGCDYFVRLVPFPPGSPDGVVTPNDDGTYNIYLDINRDRPHQMEACDHEVGHLVNDDLYSPSPIDQLEPQAAIAPPPRRTWDSWFAWAQEMMAVYGWVDDPSIIPPYVPAKR